MDDKKSFVGSAQSHGYQQKRFTPLDLEEDSNINLDDLVTTLHTMPLDQKHVPLVEVLASYAKQQGKVKATTKLNKILASIPKQ